MNVPAAARHVHPPTSGFAGYFATAPAVTEIAASWSVPAIAAKSPAGSASTWIGAQTASGGFVQVGTVEEETIWGYALYQGFWSDPAKSFRPQMLGFVRPGDRITAEMRQGQDGGWILELRDTTRASVRTVEPPGNGGSFNRGEWLQEDPVASEDGFADVTYPTMSEVTFTALSLDGRPPALSYAANGAALTSPNGVCLVPTPVRDDGFTVHPPPAAGAAYLRAVLPLNVAIQELEVASATPAGAKTAGAALIEAFGRFDAALSRMRWPAALDGDVSLFEAHNAQVVSDLRRLEAATAATAGAALQTLFRAMSDDPRLSSPIRAAVGLPSAP